jgi:hypothetical protein
VPTIAPIPKPMLRSRRVLDSSSSSSPFAFVWVELAFGGSRSSEREIGVRLGPYKYDFDMPVSAIAMTRFDIRKSLSVAIER